MDIIDSILKFESLQDKVKRLKQKMKFLESRKEDIMQELNYAESLSMKRRKKSVETWLESVDKMKTKVHELEQRLKWKILNQFGRLPSEIDRAIMDVDELSQQVFHEGPTFEVHDVRGLELQANELIGRKLHMKNMILESLRNNEILSIGIYGMGGVGKTTLAMHIYNALLNDPLTFVAWFTVSQNFSINKLQNDLARALQMTLRDEDDKWKRAALITRALKSKKNVVLIIDNLWKVFVPESVGIELGGGCKVVLTSRSSEVCDRMACHSKFEVAPLNEEEAWMLFTRTLGTTTENFTSTPEIEEIAKCLARECAGLPLGIITVAGSMRGVDDIREWRDALEAMGTQSADNPLFENVFQILRYSYDALNDNTVKECLLYCSLFPKDHRINRDDLIALFVDEGLIREMRNREAEFNRGHTILNKLEKVCLLQGVELLTVKHVKMHDLVRDMALRIANEDHRFLVKAGELRLVDVAGKESWSKDVERVSFMRSTISDTLSEASRPRCLKLLTLLFRSCQNITRIPGDFFTHMIRLSVLDVSRTKIVELPASVSSLSGLKALLLSECSKLESVVPLTDLIALKRLDLSFTRIKQLPQGMGMLEDLRELNLTCVDSLGMIPQGILSKLSHLQHLALPKFRIQKVIAEEIASLQKLEKFQGKFNCINGLDTFLRSWKDGPLPNEYSLVVDDLIWKETDDGVEKFVYFRKCHDLRRLCELASLNNASDLRNCYVTESDKISHLLCQDCYNLPFIPRLKVIALHSLPSLSDLVWDGTCSASLVEIPRTQSTAGTFSLLKEFKISRCPTIKKLFTIPLLSHLLNLEKLEVFDCKKLEEIVQVVPEDEDKQDLSVVFKPKGKRNARINASGVVELHVFPELRILQMMGLPELKSFCTSRKMVSDSIQEIAISNCPKLKKLPLIKEELCPSTSLVRITVDEDWWKSSEFDQPNAKQILSRFVTQMIIASDGKKFRPLWHGVLAWKRKSEFFTAKESTRLHID